MKWILTDNNILYDNSYSNILYFGTEEKRDQYVNNYLLDNYLEKLSQRPNINQQLLDVVENVISIGITREELENKNYIIIEDNLGNISFHFINGYENDGNNNSFTLSIEKDLNMTYPTIWDNIKNIYAEQTHINNYFGYEIDGGHKEVINIKNLSYNNNDEVYNQLKNKGWLVVFERVNNESDYISKTNNGKTFKEPFKIYIAPLTPIKIKSGESFENIIYYQPDPTAYSFMSSEIENQETSIYLGLNDNVDPEYDVNIYIHYTTNSYSNVQKTYTISKDLFPFDNQEKIIILPLNGSTELANEITNIIQNNEIYNDPLIMNQEVLTGSSRTENIVEFLPIKIIKNSDISYTIKSIKWSEIINNIPNAQLRYINNNQIRILSYVGYPDHYGLYNPNSYINFNLEIDKISQTEENVWSIDNLLNYLEDPTDTLIIGSRTTNFIAIDTDQPSGIIDLDISNNLKYDDDKEIYYISFLNYTKLLSINKYIIDFSDYTKYDLIEGLNKYSFGIENLKEFDLNANYINKETKQMTFEHYASFTPDWEERLKFIDNSYLNLTNDENSFINSKEFIKGNDILAQYKVNDPVKSKFDWLRPIFSLGNVASLFLGKERAARRIGKTITNKKFGRVGTKTILGKRGGRIYKPKYGYRTDTKSETYNDVGGGGGTTGKILRALPLIGGIAQVPVQRANMRKSPDQFQGNGDINGDLIFNYNSINFSLYQYEFINPSRKAIIRDLKMHGINDQIFLETLWDYKQTSFNFYKLGDIDISNSQSLRTILKPEEYDQLNEIIMGGFTLWYNVDTYLDWESNDEIWE